MHRSNTLPYILSNIIPLNFVNWTPTLSKPAHNINEVVRCQCNCYECSSFQIHACHLLPFITLAVKFVNL